MKVKINLVNSLCMLVCAPHKKIGVTVDETIGIPLGLITTRLSWNHISIMT